MVNNLFYNDHYINSLQARDFYFDLFLYFFLKKKKQYFFIKVNILNQYINLFSNKKKYKLDKLFFFITNNFILNIFLLRFLILLKYYTYSYDNFLKFVPNYLDNSVLEIPANSKYIIIKEQLRYTKEFKFLPKEHFELFPNYQNIITLDSSLLMSGQRFSVFHGNIAKLHRSLGQFMLDVHTQKHKYLEIYVPFLVKENTLVNSGQLPKFYFDQYKISGDDLWLIPTGEVPLVNLVSNKILKNSILPLKFVCISSCFRKETGSYGKDLKGIFRQHQFEKVELIQVTEPNISGQALENLINDASYILDCLKIPYRIILLDGKDTGFTSAKTYDIEVWLPGKRCFQEVSSCSNTCDFQSKRMNTKCYIKDKNKAKYVHILNGSGLAVGRMLIAIIENYQDLDGNIIVPDVLIPYMGINKILLK